MRLHERADLSGLLLAIRRISIVAMMLLGYLFFIMSGIFSRW
ncbi:MAG: hypothetical protein R3F53_12340 [Gammaproteobacteria bacterium]